MRRLGFSIETWKVYKDDGFPYAIWDEEQLINADLGNGILGTIDGPLGMVECYITKILK